ncbi:MAG: hypothetical protein ABFC96_08780 [Thermoguttaceae bacterium]
MVLTMATYCLALTTLVLGVPQQSGSDEIQPTGEYAKIDVKLTNKAIGDLLGDDMKRKQTAVKSVLASPDKYAPIVLCALSNVLFDEGKKDEAAFWYYAGILRCRFDALRCADVTAREGIGVIHQNYGQPIMQYTLEHPAKVEAMLPRIAEWDRTTPYNYDHRWINLHGMAAVMESTGTNEGTGKHPQLSLPKDQWKSLAEKTRTEYVDTMHNLLKEVATQPPAKPNTEAKAKPTVKPNAGR